MAAMHPAGTARERTAEADLQPAVAARLQDDEARGLVSGLDQRVAADGAGREPELELAVGSGKDRKDDAAGSPRRGVLSRPPPPPPPPPGVPGPHAGRAARA